MRPSAITPRIGLGITALTGALLLLCVAAAVASEAGADIRTGASARIDDWVNDRMAARGLPGVAVAVVRGGQWFGQWRPAALPYDDAGVAMGYVASTAADVATFMQAHLEGHPAIPASAVDIATGPVEPTGWTTTLDAGYGRGWFVDELAARRS